jgi:hypothetical protein
MIPSLWTRRLLLSLVFAIPLPSIQAAMTVTGEMATEAGPTGEAPRVRFTLTQSPAQPVASTWEFATQPDTALEGIDYVGQRGTVTLPANATTVVVEVPLLGDTWREPTESFALLVWPQGGTPLAGLNEIPKPAIDGFQWQYGSIGVSGDSFFINRSLGVLGNGSWRHERELALPAGSRLGINPIGGHGRWMALVDSESDPAFEGPWWTRLHIADRLSSAQSPLPFAAPIHLPGRPTDILSVQVRGNVACVRSFDACRFYQLDPAGPPRLMGQCFLPRPWGVLFDGRRLAAISDDARIGLQIFEATDASLAHWRLVKTMPGKLFPAALDADRLVLRRDVVEPAPQTVFDVHERLAGGGDGWGKTAELTVTESEGPRQLGTVSLTGNLILIGDPQRDHGAGPRPGKFHVFAKNTADPGWSGLGTITAPAAAPGDTFGWQLAAGGTAMLTTTETGGAVTSTRAWIGSLTGGTATIVDDDAPVAHFSLAPAFEPTESVRNAQGWIWLTHPLPDAVSVTWRTRPGTATAGEDFTVRESTTVIPAGAHAAAIEVPLRPDDSGEPDESFTLEIISITSATGATVLAGPPAAWTIRDTDRIPSAYASGSYLYEGLDSPSPTVRIDAANSTVDVNWSLRAAAPPPSGMLAGIDGFATAGTDFTPSTGSLQASTSGTRNLPVSTLRDDLPETTELAALALDLNPLASAASYGTRAFGSLVDLPLPSFLIGTVSTDGDRVAVEIIARHAVRLYVRDAQSPGGWRPDQVLQLADFGIPMAQGPRFLKIRQGRLCYYLADAGRVWILIEDPAAPGSWKLEASFMTRAGLNDGVFTDADFDGDAFITSRRSPTLGGQVFIHERGHGDWAVQQDVLVPGLVTDVRLDGHTIAGLSTPLLALAVIERNGFGATPWVLRPPSPLPNDSLLETRPPLIHRNVAVLKRRLLEPSLVMRRRDDGSWESGQILDADIVAIDRGVLIGRSPANSGPPANRSFTDSGTAPNLWVQLPPNDPDLRPPHAVAGTTVFDHCRRVLVGSADIVVNPNDPPVPGVYIAEPGADLRLIDAETFVIGVSRDPLSENGTVVVNNSVGLYRSLPAPLDITIPFRTLSSGTATPDVDFRPVSGTLVLRSSLAVSGQSWTSFAVPILPDRLMEGPETVLIEFGTPSFGVIEPSTVELSIPANTRLAPAVTLPRPPVLFEPLTGQQSLTVPLRLSTAHAEPLVVGYRFVAQTAAAADVSLTSGTVTVPSGILDLPVPITVLADSLVEPAETVRLIIDSFNGLTVTATQFDLTIDDAPVAGGSPDAFTAIQNTPLEPSPARNLTTNDASGTSGVALARPAANGVVTVLPDGTFRYEPDANFLGLDRFAYTGAVAGESVLAADATWRWLHPLNGRDPGTSVPGFQAEWMRPAFDDTSWQTGTGLMGYGTLGPSPGQPITTPIGTPTGNRYSAYFRTTFTAPATPAAGVTVEFSCDDAAIFYLNGTELGRYVKAPDPAFLAAPDTYQLLANSTHDNDEETALRTLSVPAAQLKPGVNVLAISVHNQSIASSDLGLRVTSVRTGFNLTPVVAEVLVTDNAAPPRIVDDTFTVTVETNPLDSRFFPAGSLYANDRLLSVSGTPYDPILEAETGGNPLGLLLLDKDTGHFRIVTPPGFFGTTSFTYRVRDKDGWSNHANVTLTVNPVRAFDLWRQTIFGGGFNNPASAPENDPEGDSLTNLAEFAFGTNPQSPDFAPVLTLERQNGAWLATFNTLDGFGRDTVIRLEASSSLTGGSWSQLALLNDQFPTIEEFAPGVTASEEKISATHLRYSIDLPPMPDPASFLRLRVSQEPHLMDP